MKLKNIIMLVSLLLIISACKGKITDKPTITTEDIYKGSDGLVMSFLENAPPNEVYEDSSSTIGLRLENKGAYSIEDGYLAISLEKDYMTAEITSLKSTSEKIEFGGEDHITFDLKGRSIEAPAGDQDTLTLTANVKELEKLSQIHTSTAAITACYNYKTATTATICMDSDIYNLKQRTKSCTIKDISLTDQGAPVAVIKIETNMLPKESGVEPQFLITIQNKGKGLVIEKDSVIDACYSEALDYSKLNKLYVNAYLTKKGGMEKLDCNIDDEKETAEAILKENRAVVRCKYKEDIKEVEGTYSTPLLIEIDYGYTSTISKNIKIKKITI